MRCRGGAMQNGGGGWRLQGPDPCAAEAGEADSEAGSEARVAGDDEGGRFGGGRRGRGRR